MRSAVARIALKIIELLGCVACFITKIITDLEARRVFIRNQKFSREWGLLHNVTWSSAGNSFANITYGGFTLITALMLISRCIDAKSRPSLTEKIFLIVGMLCFFAMGGIVLAAFDQVPAELHDNSLILGGLSFFVALIMLFDLADPMARHVTDTTQTDSNIIMTTSLPQPTSSSSVALENDHAHNHSPNINNAFPSMTNGGVNTKNNRNQSMIAAHDINNRSVDVHDTITANTGDNIVNDRARNRHRAHDHTSPDSSPDVEDITKNGRYHRSDSIDFVQTQHLPQAEQPVFERVLLPEKKRPTFNKIPDPEANAVGRSVQTIQSMHSTQSPIAEENLHYQHDPYYNSNYERKQSYAISQRNQPPAHHSVHQVQRSDRQHTVYAQQSKPYHNNYAYDEYDEHSDNPPPRYVLKGNAPSAAPKNRYRDYSNDHLAPPMMVIRNYGQTVHSVSKAAYGSKSHNNSSSRQYQTAANNNRTTYTNGGVGGHDHSKYAAVNVIPNSKHKKNCCEDIDDDDDDGVVDFRKMNSAIRPGFVASAAKMWDQRAAEKSGELNTIV